MLFYKTARVINIYQKAYFPIAYTSRLANLVLYSQVMYVTATINCNLAYGFATELNEYLIAGSNSATY
jgi:hypothetical protein